LTRNFSLPDHDTTATAAQKRVAKPEIGLMLSGRAKQLVVAAEGDVFSVPAAGMFTRIPTYHNTLRNVAKHSAVLCGTKRLITLHEVGIFVTRSLLEVLQ